MQKIISKGAENKENLRDSIFFYNRARDGFLDILKNLKEQEEYTLMIPSYIGYSPNEGSGIYDPICSLKIKHEFYNLDENINIDLEDFEAKLSGIQGKVVLLIVHYFGYKDPNAKAVIDSVKHRDGFVIEDCAHGLYTDYIDNNCGRDSDVAFYSLHKMLPINGGGMVRVNTHINMNLQGIDKIIPFYQYDLYRIAQIRKRNALLLEEQLKDVEGIRIIRKNSRYKNQTPQTFPIILENVDKNKFYHRLNEKGYGVVSLYHTMIDEIVNNNFQTSINLSKTIINLPVHQDIHESELIAMCNEIKDYIEVNRCL